MAASVAIADQGSSQSTQHPPKYRLVRLWSDKVRVEQRIRLKALELQPGDEYGQQAWELGNEAHRNLPEWVRLDLPRSRVLGRILGMLRSGATVKEGKILRFEVSAKDIAERLGISKSTVEAALRWLSCGPIIHHGEQISRGLGLIHRGRRTGLAFLDGKLRQVYRTSRIVLTALGRILLGLGAVDEQKAEKKRKARQYRKTNKSRTPISKPQAQPPQAELEHIQGHGDDGGGKSLDGDPMTLEVGHHWLNKIKERL